MTTEPLTIDFYADIACPWCYIGERRLQAVLAEHPDLTVERRWHPFQLNPQIPPAGEPWSDFVASKFGNAQQAQAIFARVNAAGAPDGIHFAWEQIPTAPNTVILHRLIAAAPDDSVRWQLIDGLFVAHFSAGQDLTDPAVLQELAIAAGMAADQIDAVLQGDAQAAEVRRALQATVARGVTGVPVFVFADRLVLHGAQPLEVLQQALARVQ